MLSGPFLKYAAQEGERVKAQYELDGMRDRARVVGRCSSTDVCMLLGRCHMQASVNAECTHVTRHRARHSRPQTRALCDTIRGSWTHCHVHCPQQSHNHTSVWASQDDMRDWLRAINGVIDTLALNPPPDGSKTPLRRARSATALSTGSRRSFSDQGAGVCQHLLELRPPTFTSPLYASVYHFQLSPLLQLVAP